MRGAVRGSADRKVIRLTRPVVKFNPAFCSRRFESSHRFDSENFDSKDRSKFVEVRRVFQCVVVSTSRVLEIFASPPDSIRILGILSQDTLYRILSPPLSCPGAAAGYPRSGTRRRNGAAGDGSRRDTSRNGGAAGG